jgi:hypothetical protein
MVIRVELGSDVLAPRDLDVRRAYQSSCDPLPGPRRQRQRRWPMYSSIE